VLDALNSMNIDLSKIRIFHSDRGGEFSSHDLEKYMNEHGIEQSMSKAGCPFDNAVSENMFKLLKVEVIDQNYEYDIELIDDVNTWVNWYNNVRIHSKIGYTSPTIYREQYNLKVI
ncbi:MAG: transposase, partial [Bacilli bacterium]